MSVPLWSYFLVRRPAVVQRRLTEFVSHGHIDRTLTLWQVVLGMAYMQFRVLRRPESIGLSDGALARENWRARWLQWRIVRAPCLLWERVVAPIDLVGLGASPSFLTRHLIGAYHPGENALYDLAVLSVVPGALEALRARVRGIVDGTDPRSEWFRDLVVYEGYHETLLALVERCCAGDFDPAEEPAIASDATLAGFLEWCGSQPDSPRSTIRAWRRGELSFQPTR